MKSLWMMALAAVVCWAVACDDKSANTTAMHAGQGEEVTVDSPFEIKIRIADGPEATYSSRMFAVYESRPAKPPASERPQGFELRGEKCVIAGSLPADFKLAPKTEFLQLVGKPLSVMSHGGDPSAPAMTKVTTADGRTYVGKKGTFTVDRAFYKKGQYAAVSGTMDLEMQEVKLGNPDDPNNKGDQPIGEPVKATGTFSARAQSFAYEQL